jgi:hypothetical protein
MRYPTPRKIVLLGSWLLFEAMPLSALPMTIATMTKAAPQMVKRTSTRQIAVVIN